MGGFGVAKLILLVALACVCARSGHGIGLGRKLNGLVEESVVLKYHNGPLLTSSKALDVHIIWYGKFSAAQRSIVGDFVQSLGDTANVKQQPSVSEWWKTTELYTSSSSKNNGGVLTVKLGKQVVDESYSAGKSLKRSDIGSLVERAAKSNALPKSESRAVVYLVLTSADVMVERFCTSSCGFHDDGEVEGVKVAYAWVGNAEMACPGQCAWPFHQPIPGPGGAQRGRRNRRNDHQRGHGVSGSRNESVRQRILSGRCCDSSGSGVSVRRNVWKGGVPRICWATAARRLLGRFVQRPRHSFPHIPAARHVGSPHFNLQNPGLINFVPRMGFVQKEIDVVSDAPYGRRVHHSFIHYSF